MALACALARPSNLLVLDEPTNDLDLETLELLQELLGDYPGTVILVSHDRDFLDRVATNVVNAEGDGRWIEYAGGYSDMLAQRGKPVLVPVVTNKPRNAALNSIVAGPAKKLSFKDKHALANLPAEMEALQRVIATETRRLADPNLYSRDPARFNAATATLAKAETDLAVAEERWLELELMREMVEAR